MAEQKSGRYAITDPADIFEHMRRVTPPTELPGTAVDLDQIAMRLMDPIDVHGIPGQSSEDDTAH